MLNNNLFKQIELYLRSNQQFPIEILTELSNMSDWDLKITNDFIIRVKNSIAKNNIEFIYKQYENIKTKEDLLNNIQTIEEKDLLICLLRRNQYDYYLTDAKNRLVIPDELIKHDFFEIWGYDVTTARNICVEHALKNNFKYILFIDDDILAPNNALLRLWNTHKSYNCLVSSAIYTKKVEPLSLPFNNSNGEIPMDNQIHEADKLIGLGFALINIKELTKKIPLPLFWTFVDNNGIWTMGEDAFFIQNMMNYINKPAIVDTSIKCLHFDKKYKRFYGEREENVIYASKILDFNPEMFFENRIPPKFPVFLICSLTRKQNDPVAYNLSKMFTDRSYHTQHFHVYGQPVDVARNICALEALKREAEFILFLDDDIQPPQDLIPILVDDYHQIKKFDPTVIAVSADYPMKNDLIESVHLNIDTDGVVRSISKMSHDSKYIKSNWMVAAGALLINTQIFKQSHLPYFQCFSNNSKDGELVNEDAFFTELCLRNGFNIYINHTLKCKHVNLKTDQIFSF